MKFFNVENFAKITAEQIVKIAETNAKDYAFKEENNKKKYKIKTNQLRNFFSHVQTIRNDFNRLRIEKEKEHSYTELDTKLILIKPKLAYAVGRSSNEVASTYRDFQTLVVEAIDLTVKTDKEEKEKAYENFFALIEGIIAYHKYHGGKEN